MSASRDHGGAEGQDEEKEARPLLDGAAPEVLSQAKFGGHIATALPDLRQPTSQSRTITKPSHAPSA